MASHVGFFDEPEHCIKQLAWFSVVHFFQYICRARSQFNDDFRCFIIWIIHMCHFIVLTFVYCMLHGFIYSGEPDSNHLHTPLS
jgi:hypothetical protein